MTEQAHELLEGELGGQCGAWWRGGATATGARVTHECDLPVGHAGPCTCSCGRQQRPVPLVDELAREGDDDDELDP